MIKKLGLLLISFLIIGIFYSLGRQIYDSLQASYRLDNATDKVAILQKKNQELKNKLNDVSSVGYVEQQARDKLNLARPGETIIIIPDDQIDQIIQSKKQSLPQVETLPNWQGWLRLFLK